MGNLFAAVFGFAFALFLWLLGPTVMVLLGLGVLELLGVVDVF